MNERAATVGQQLQAARGNKGLSAQNAADVLRLDGWVIEGLESGNYERIGPAVYAKGHLKRYAELLGLPVAEVLADFDGSSAPIAAPTLPGGLRMRTVTPVGGAPPWPALFGCMVAVLVVAGILWWRPWHPRGPGVAAAMAAGFATPMGVATGGVPVGGVAGGGVPAGAGRAGTVFAGRPPVAASTPAPTEASTTASPAAAAGDAEPPSASGRARLRLSFLADSWVDVRDVNGQRLFAGTGHVNNVRSMSGTAPFRIYIKSASSIRMEINNREVAIGPQFVVADAAHFEAGADGVLRRDLHAR